MLFHLCSEWITRLLLSNCLEFHGTKSKFLFYSTSFFKNLYSDKTCTTRYSLFFYCCKYWIRIFCLSPPFIKNILLSKAASNSSLENHFKQVLGEFHKSWAHNIKRREHPNLRKNAISGAQGTNAWCQIRVNLCKKDGLRAQVSRVGLKLLYEINPLFDKLLTFNKNPIKEC
jgi:hypothetical protein